MATNKFRVDSLEERVDILENSINILSERQKMANEMIALIRQNIECIMMNMKRSEAIGTLKVHNCENERIEAHPEQIKPEESKQNIIQDTTSDTLREETAIPLANEKNKFTSRRAIL